MVVIMYTLIVYDIGEERVSKVLKFLRTYLNWIQNSVFEGELTDAQLLKVKNHLIRIINEKDDSVIIFSSREKRWISKTIIGKEKNSTDNFI